MKNFFISLLIIIFGFLITWKTNWIVENFGRNDWAEQKLGSEGGSRLVYMLIGISIMIFGALLMTGLMEGVIFGIFGNKIGV